MIEVIYIQLRGEGKVVPYNPRGIVLNIGDNVIIEVDRGIDYGFVVSKAKLVEKLDTKEVLKSVIRKVRDKDVEKIKENEKGAVAALEKCRAKVVEHGLPMKLVKADYSFDKSKIVFYFTADGRVDFRELVKDLASMFKLRIELRQIGVRDEAKMLGGCGHCGRVLCCASFLKSFEPVTIKMAKEQRLSLNPTKISGLCGRLMCCLGYENDLYKKYSKALPSEGDLVKTDEGEFRVFNVDILKREVTAISDDGTLKVITYPIESGSKENGK